MSLSFPCVASTHNPPPTPVLELHSTKYSAPLQLCSQTHIPTKPALMSNQRPTIKGHYNPFLFAMMTCAAMAELGLTAFLIAMGNENGTWPTPRYHRLWVIQFNIS